MKFTGMIRTVGLDYETGKNTITLMVDNSADAFTDLEELTDRTVSVEIKKTSHQRSLKANAYAWVLMQLIGERLDMTKDDVYLMMLGRHSRSFSTIWLEDTAYEEFKLNWRLVEQGEPRYTYRKVNGKRKRINGHDVICYYGMSTFDNQEMRVFIDGLIRDCHDLKISTIPEEEAERMKAQWGIR